MIGLLGSSWLKFYFLSFALDVSEYSCCRFRDFISCFLFCCVSCCYCVSSWYYVAESISLFAIPSNYVATSYFLIVCTYMLLVTSVSLPQGTLGISYIFKSVFGSYLSSLILCFNTVFSNCLSSPLGTFYSIYWISSSLKSGGKGPV